MQEGNKDVISKGPTKALLKNVQKNRRNKHKKMPVGEIGKQREAEKHEGIKQKKEFSISQKVSVR